MPRYRATVAQVADAARGLTHEPWMSPGAGAVVEVISEGAAHGWDVADAVLPDPAALGVQAGFESLPAVLVGTHPGWVDVLLGDADLSGDDQTVIDALEATVTAAPIAAVSCAQVLRGAPHRSLADALLVESAVYSTLQAGPEFARWVATRPPPAGRPMAPDAVVVERVTVGASERVTITLNRPEVRNALDVAMRDGLLAALAVVDADPAVDEFWLLGAGPAFCAGGDLRQFATFPDPATAHLVRLTASIARMLHRVADRGAALVHGATVGSGIEMAAFLRRVVADPSTVVSLPEVRLGLIPGAGGTWSLPQRIGRHRTARLVLTGERWPAELAHAVGLVDEVATHG